MGYNYTGAHTLKTGSASTSTPIDSTGSGHIIVIVSWETDAGVSSITVSDNKGNGNATGCGKVGAGAFVGEIFYWHAPTVGSGHTFTISGGSSFACFEVLCFSDSAAIPLDQSAGAAPDGDTTTTQPGSITPSQDNELIICGWIGAGTTNTLSINSGFTITDWHTWNGGANVGGGAAYLIQTSAAAVNPTWTADTGSCQGSMIASFKAAAATSRLRFNSNLDGLSASGGFFANRLAA